MTKTTPNYDSIFNHHIVAKLFLTMNNQFTSYKVLIDVKLSIGNYRNKMLLVIQSKSLATSTET